MAAVSVFIIITILYRVKETWRYHGAEHKTIYAYENNIELTLGNVRACPRVAKRCGTNLVVFLILFYTPLAFFIEYESVKLVIAFMLAYELFDLDNGGKIPVIKLFFKLGNWFQHRVFTAEPTDEQLTAAIETMKALVNYQGTD
jgi:uncharacterized protein YqhQ